MLVLSRKKNDSIIIDDQIEIKVIAVEGDTIKLGIEAPKYIAIHRKEVYIAIQEENKLATQLGFDLKDYSKLKKQSEPQNNKLHIKKKAKLLSEDVDINKRRQFKHAGQHLNAFPTRMWGKKQIQGGIIK